MGALVTQVTAAFVIKEDGIFFFYFTVFFLGRCSPAAFALALKSGHLDWVVGDLLPPLRRGAQIVVKALSTKAQHIYGIIVIIVIIIIIIIIVFVISIIPLLNIAGVE